MIKQNQAVRLVIAAIVVLKSVSQLKRSILNISGVAESKRKIKLVVKAAGKVGSINAEVGQSLKKGEAVIAIEAKSKKELYKKAKIRLNQSEIEFKSTSTLYKKKLASETDLAKLKANLSSAEADLKQAEIDYLSTQVVAPFDGYIDEILVNEGDYVSDMLDNSPIGTFVALELMITKAQEVADAKIRSLKPGLRATMKTLNGLEVEGKVNAISEVINNTTSSFPIEIIFANEAGKVLHGQALSVKIFLGGKQAHRLPQSVLVLNAQSGLEIKSLDAGNVVHFNKATIVDEKPGYVAGHHIGAHVLKYRRKAAISRTKR
ncbi:MAG: Multidrug efflux pump subunit AcrA (membrane-fusion protein) [Candidatus Midichloria mitochondrii]|uniref:RND family efflux transporter MFP subunit n=1 Tax=Midichloria mitochondrii (strain IricVA) TaxID=696127 RepID=F7XVD2_MIDMI|nr:efflux RND transporter periplasmic adaptor subunit [Candidatus Midichloria mitochondrii]AEI88631.1 RND family efflux transporter MFP subunit [Candidatus Midichloria mitochondrii IricVA]MDJ1583392.1 efflux RND transporter periplasmic adaptor subunit [Candidatus Midichloria mitochondrii]